MSDLRQDTATGKWYDNEDVKILLRNADSLRAMIPTQSTKETKGKLDPTLIPFSAVESIVKVREFGNKKYTPESFYKVAPELLLAAVYRHVAEVLKQEDLMLADKESGLLHLEHALCSLAGVVEIIKKKST